MKLIFNDEDERLSREIRALMSEACDAALRLEFGELLDDETFAAAADMAETGVTVVSSGEIRELNREYRSIDRVTDVLSFPQFADSSDMSEELAHGSHVLAGDVVICYDRALEQSEEYETGITRELVYLFTHSMLHLLGYDHMEEDEKRLMRAREEEIMEEIGVGR